MCIESLDTFGSDSMHDNRWEGEKEEDKEKEDKTKREVNTKTKRKEVEKSKPPTAQKVEDPDLVLIILH